MPRPALALAPLADPTDSATFTLESAQVWRGDRLANRAGQGDAPALPSGHTLLDAQLPGGGWTAGTLVELLQDGPGRFDWQLLAPALASLLARHDGPLVLVGGPDLQTDDIGPPDGSMHWSRGTHRPDREPAPREASGGKGSRHRRRAKQQIALEPFGPALIARGVPLDRLLWVRADALAARLWAAEQALRCAPVAAILAWLPRVPTAALRRLHMAAQAHGKPFFVFRPGSVRQESSPAPLRLQLSGVEKMEVDLFKRRGPPLTAPLKLAARPAQLAALLAATHARRIERAVQAGDAPHAPHATETTATAPTGPEPVLWRPARIVALAQAARRPNPACSANSATRVPGAHHGPTAKVAHALACPSEPV